MPETLQYSLHPVPLLEIPEPDATQARHECRRGDDPKRMRGDNQAPPEKSRDMIKARAIISK